MASVDFANHVSQLGSGFKRPLTGTPSGVSEAKQLRLPTDAVPGGPPFTARPDKFTNVTVPVARASSTAMEAGEIAFVYRGDRYTGPALGANGLTAVLSLEQLNAELAKPEHHLAADVLTRRAAQNAVFFARGNEYVSRTVQVFTGDGETATKAKIPETHPIRQYALDGVVSTNTEIDCPYLNGTAQFTCNVAVKGPSVFNLKEPRYGYCPPNATLQQQLAATSDPLRAFKKGYYVKPLKVLSKVYVVLMSEDVEGGKKKLFYEVVTQSNLDLDPGGGTTLFRATLGGNGVGKRETLKAYELGVVTDTRFGPVGAQMIVNVKIDRYERMKYESVAGPKRKSLPVDAKKLFVDQSGIVYKKTGTTDVDSAEQASFKRRRYASIRNLKPSVPTPGADGKVAPLPRYKSSGDPVGLSAEQFASLAAHTAALTDSVQRIYATSERARAEQVHDLYHGIFSECDDRFAGVDATTAAAALAAELNDLGFATGERAPVVAAIKRLAAANAGVALEAPRSRPR